MALQPCHYGFQIVVRPLSNLERFIIYKYNEKLKTKRKLLKLFYSNSEAVCLRIWSIKFSLSCSFAQALYLIAKLGSVDM